MTCWQNHYHKINSNIWEENLCFGNVPASDQMRECGNVQKLWSEVCGVMNNNLVWLKEYLSSIIFTTYDKRCRSKGSRKRVLRDGCSILNSNSTYVKNLFRRIFADNQIKGWIIRHVSKLRMRYKMKSRQYKEIQKEPK